MSNASRGSDEQSETVGAKPISERQRPLVVAALRGISAYSTMLTMSFVSVAEHWLGNLSDDDLASLGKSVRKVFREAKQAVSEHRLDVDLYRPLGGLLGPEPKVERDFAEIAFDLWRKRFPPWEALCDEVGFGKVFAFIAMSYNGGLSLESLSHLVRFLTGLLIAECQYFRERAARPSKSAAALPKARRERARKQRERANALTALARTMAVDFWRARPSASKAAVVGHLRRSGNFDGWSANSTFERAIKGCKREALQEIGS